MSYRLMYFVYYHCILAEYKQIQYELQYIDLYM